MENKKKLSLMEGWRRNLRAWRLLWGFCPGLFVSGALNSAVKAFTPYVTIWLSARLIDELAGGRDPEKLFRWVICQLSTAAVLALFGGILTRWYDYEWDRASKMDDYIYMDKMMRLDYADIDRQYVFDLYSQVCQNRRWSGWGLRKAGRFISSMSTAVFRILGGLFLAVGLFTAKVPAGSAVAFLNHPLCAAVMAGLLLAIAVASPACANQSNKFWIRFADDALFANRLFNVYGFSSKDRKRSLDTRIYDQQENVDAVYMRRGNMFLPGNSGIANWARGPMGLWMAASKAVSAVLTGVVYLFVCLKAWGGAFGVGLVTQYVGAIMNLFLGISELLEMLGDMRNNGEFLGTLFEFLDMPNRMYQGSLTTEKRSDRQYEVEFRDVSFRYPDSERWALRHVSMRFQVGSRLAVVGMNGSGKTTFIKLLCRLYDPTEGEILLNGIDIRKYRYEDYIDLFSVVFQDFGLLSLKLGENVAGSANVDRERVMACLGDAGFLECMERMPEGLDTYLYKEIDKEGVEVSGGEAQKLAIARALYKDAPFIVLDEPTAALDPVAEAEVYSRFNEIAGDKTAIYISHRLSSCRFCDEIAVFHEGAVIQQGTHEELVENTDGKYYELWSAQAQYYARA